MPESSLPVAAAAQPAPPPGNRFNSEAVLKWLEPAAAALGFLLLIALHVFFRQKAGALWRDEINSVNLATLPSFADTWHYLQFDSFPILIFAVLRGWAAVFSSGDVALRTFGALIGCGIFAAFWLNARLFTVRWPLISLALLGCNSLFIRYTASIRAYGLGILLMLLAFAAIWRATESATPRRLALAVVAAVLSVQSIYYGSVLLFAMCTAGAIVALTERDWRKAVSLLGVGAIAAVSLLPYAGTIHQLKGWNYLVQHEMSATEAWYALCVVIGSPDPIGIFFWLAVFFAGLGLAAWRLRVRPVDRAVLFAALALAIGTVCYAVFLKTLNYLLQPWYFISYLAFAAVCLDAILGRLAASLPFLRYARVALIVVSGALMFLQAREDLYQRQTNVDLIAERVQSLAVKGDLIVNARWECAITFDRYYHGAAAQVSVPPLTDAKFHHYDQIKAAASAPNPMAPVFQQMGAALRGGHKIWYIGVPVFGPVAQSLLQGPQVMDGPPGSTGRMPVYGVWQAQACEYLRRHVLQGTEVNVVCGQPVMFYEKLPLSVFSGWRTEPGKPAAAQ